MKTTTATALVLTLGLAGPVAAAQTPQAAPQRGAKAQTPEAPPSFVVDVKADELKDQVQRLMDQYPPAVGEMLRIDPTIALNDTYMSSYPGMRALVAQHPEIVQNGRYFFGLPQYGGYAQQQRSNDPGAQKIREVREMFGGLLIFAGLMALLTAVAWLIKMTVDHRRWLRASKMQSEMQGRLLDKLTANEELVAFVQSPTGQRALEALALPTDRKGRHAGVVAPLNRILWSIQLGTIGSLLGFGLMLLTGTATIQTSWASDISPLFFIMGIICLSIGIGFIISAAASFFLSRRLGLLAAPASVDA